MKALLQTGADFVRNKKRLASILLGAMLAFLPGLAHADDWGCQVLLCLSDPRGPETESACRPPIERLYHTLEHGGAFPNCAMAGSPSDGGSYVVQSRNPFDLCPTGTTRFGGLASDSSVVPMVTVGKRTGTTPYGSPIYTFEQDPMPPVISSNSDYGDQLPVARACVGTLVGTQFVSTQDDEQEIFVYDRIVEQRAQSPRALDVYINGRLYRRVHW